MSLVKIADGVLSAKNLDILHVQPQNHCKLVYGVEQWYSTGGTRTPGGTRRHPKILFFVI
jgi:hypothetical protein